MKDKPTSTQVLTLLEGTEGFVVYCDFSQIGMGYFIMKHGKIIEYAFIKFKVHEKNYSTHDLELMTIVYYVKIWRHYQKSLKYVFNQKNFNLRQRRWILMCLRMTLLVYQLLSLHHEEEKRELDRDGHSRTFLNV